MRLRYFLTLILAGTIAPLCAAGDRAQSSPPPTTPSYVVTNDDIPASIFGESSISYFQAGGSPTAPALTYETTLTIGGTGAGGGNFGAPSMVSLPDSGAQCLYVSDSGSGQIVSVSIPSQAVLGTFSGSATDAGTSNGIGLALNANYVYASFTDSNTIGTFQVMPGCQLNFVGDTAVAGLNGGGIYAIAVHGNLLIATYGDGSIQSFNIAGGTPQSNDDEQNSTGYTLDYNNLPAGIDITSDGHYAIFGDGAVQTLVEVSDISSGRLTATRVYNLAVGPTPVLPHALMPGTSSTNVRLSPDESLLFIVNNQSGTITAANFNRTSGMLSPGCTSPRLSAFYNPWFYLGSLVTENTSGNGGVLYVAEFGTPPSIGILTVQAGSRTCALTESAASPAIDPTVAAQVLTLWAYPPRPF